MKAVFVGHQYTGDGSSFALFNVDMPGNPLHESTVTAETIKRLGIRQLHDRQGRRLLNVPLPKITLEIVGRTVKL